MLKSNKKRISIYWDSQNVSFTQELEKDVRVYAKSKGHIIATKVYYNSLGKEQVADRNKPQISGIQFVDVPCPLKNSADNQLIADVVADMSRNPSPDIVILISGDGDFAAPISSLKKLGVECIVLAQRGNVKQRLKEVAHEFRYTDKLLQLSEENNQPQKNSLESGITSDFSRHVEKLKSAPNPPAPFLCREGREIKASLLVGERLERGFPDTVKSQVITYDEAISYLIQAITTVAGQGKQTKLSRVDQVMRQLFPSYQGVSCIRKADGGKFSRFSNFIQAVEQDGTIRMDEQYLLFLE
ncbi:hypothetical protein NUACC21_56850 [Scytonema sp. NUACC21]